MTGTGVASLDVKAATARGVLNTNTPGLGRGNQAGGSEPSA